jgi:hypothetical protein
MSNRAQVKVVKRAERQDVVSEKCKCATINDEELRVLLKDTRRTLKALLNRVDRALTT